MFDIKKLEAEAAQKPATERATAAKSKIKTSLKRISDTKVIVHSREDEYLMFLWDIPRSSW